LKMGFRYNVEKDQPQPAPEKKSVVPSGPAPSACRSMLIIHQGALGDFILALPALEILRQSFPPARIVFMGYPRILELIENRFYGQEILSIDQKGMASFFVRDGSLDPPLCGFFKNFDLIVVFGKNGEGNLIKNLQRATPGQVLHVNPFPRWDERIHLADHLLKELSRYKFPTPAGGVPRLHLKDSDRDWGRSYWEAKGVTPEERTGLIILHPGSGSRKKLWPPERFLDLMRILRKRSPSRWVVILGPAEGPEIRKVFEAEGAEALILVKGLPLIQLASVMEGARLCVGNDSGISHLAAALGIPTVAIFGPTDPKVWAPRGREVAVVYRKIHCSPCPQERFFLCQNLECLKGVSVEDVLEGIGRLGLGLRSEERR